MKLLDLLTTYENTPAPLPKNKTSNKNNFNQLIKAGADLTIKNNQGITPIDLWFNEKTQKILNRVKKILIVLLGPPI